MWKPHPEMALIAGGTRFRLLNPAFVYSEFHYIGGKGGGESYISGQNPDDGGRH